MSVLKGRAIAPGYAEGEAVVYDGGADQHAPRWSIPRDAVVEEKQRFRAALRATHVRLTAVEEQVARDLGETYAQVFAAHRAVLDDPRFIASVETHISRGLVNAEAAVDDILTQRAAQLHAADDAYLRERSQDIRDVGRQIIASLRAREDHLLTAIPEGSILVTRELLPSETIDLNTNRLRGLVMEQGGENSHAAILARAIGVPALTGVVGATVKIPSGTHVLIDAERGEVIVHADKRATRSFVARRENYENVISTEAAAESELCVTSDGVPIGLYANIGRPQEATMVRIHNLDGVGLFRTEYLFLESDEPPTFDHHRTIYDHVIGELDGRPLVIRTLDLGGDKLPAFLSRGRAVERGMGVRGLRYALHERNLLETQLRAILHGHRTTDVDILFPMVLGGDDLRQGVRTVEYLANILQLASRPRIGAMIETPAALFAIDEIIRDADFLSIGTNDLTQFMLAADRGWAATGADFSVLHPAVLRALSLVLEKAAANDCPVAICGEAAGDPVIACLFVGLGARALSMSPVRAAKVRYALRTLDYREAEELARRALAAESPIEVATMLAELRECADPPPHTAAQDKDRPMPL